MTSLYFANQRRLAVLQEESENDEVMESSFGDGFGSSHAVRDGFEDEAEDDDSEDESSESTAEFHTGLAPSAAAAQLSVVADPLKQGGTLWESSSSPRSRRTLPTATAVVSASDKDSENPSDNGTFEDTKDASSIDSSTQQWITIVVVCLACFLVLMIAGAIGIGVALHQENNNDSNTSNLWMPPTMAPSARPSTSLMPTTPMEEPPPLHNVCTGAKYLTIPETVDGSTEFASVEEVQQYLAECGVETFDGPSVWFQVVGQGAVITASTCGGTTAAFRTRLSVLEGESCNNLQCVVRDDPRVVDNCDLHASVSWMAEQNVTYYILLRGWREEYGNFQLTVHSDFVPNDTCSGATPVDINGNEFVQGSTVAASADNAPCDGISTLDNLGVWYKLIGDGTRLIVSTCWGTEFDTAINVFQGECGKLRCVAANDDHSACGEQSRVEFDSVATETYYILVHGYRGQSGPFLLNVASEGSVYNDYCDDAQSLPLETLVKGSNVYADFDFGNVGTSSTFCGSGIEISGPTVWYKLLGTGGKVAVSLCNEITDFDTQLSVFTGDSCDSLICLSGNDEAEAEECGFTSELQFHTEPFQKYLVAVHGFQSATGNFAIFLEDLGGEPSFDNCEEAGGPVPLNEEISIFLSSNVTTNNGLFQCDESLDLQLTQSGAWLSVEGDGSTITASICSDSPDARILGFSGSCGSLSCVEGTDRGCSVSFSSVEGEPYYLFLSFGEAINKTSLLITSTGQPVEINDSCEQAIPLELDSGVAVNGTTIGATFDEVPGEVCGEAIDSPGVW
jgi:hypothetical protein